MVIAMMTILMFVIIGGVLVPLPRRSLDRGRLRRPQFSCRTLDDFVNLTPVKPHTPAFWTVINFNALPFCNLKIHITNGAFHLFTPYILCFELMPLSGRLKTDLSAFNLSASGPEDLLALVNGCFQRLAYLGLVP